MIAKPSADMFPLGLIGYELLTGERVFPPGTATADIKKQLLGHARLPWEHIDAAPRLKMLQGFKRPILQCLERQPAKRPSAVQVVRAWNNLFAQVTKDSTSRTAPMLM
jgi:serine/threonine protein kinase